jgi:hypothetical protein
MMIINSPLTSSSSSSSSSRSSRGEILNVTITRSWFLGVFLMSYLACSTRWKLSIHCSRASFHISQIDRMRHSTDLTTRLRKNKRTRSLLSTHFKYLHRPRHPRWSNLLVSLNLPPCSNKHSSQNSLNDSLMDTRLKSYKPMRSTMKFYRNLMKKWGMSCSAP